MQEVHARAQLLDADAAGLAARGPTAVIPRSQVEDVIRTGEFPARLVVDVGRADTETGDVTAHAQLAVDWEKPELEELLRRADEGDLELSFAEDELQHLLDESDVEAHGLRERVAVLGIVAATAGATAGGAFAHPELLGDAGSGATTSHPTSLISDIQGGTGGTTAPSFISDVQGGTGGVSAAPEAAPSFISDVQGGTGGVSSAPEAAPSFVSDIQGGTGGATTPDTSTPTFISDVQGGTGGTVAASDDGIGISMPSAADTAGLAGVALLITGAGFVAARSRREWHLPA